MASAPILASSSGVIRLTPGGGFNCFKKEDIQYTEVVIIGNGPSAICLSYMLSGHWPYYTDAPHLDPYLTMRLKEGGTEKSIVQQDLEFLSSGLEGRSSSPVALLFDTLSQPGADLGVAEEGAAVVRWRDEGEARRIPHVALGRYRAGGAWQMMDGATHTLSLGNWMQLPGVPFKDWLLKRRSKGSESGDGTSSGTRATMDDVRRYYEEYVTSQGLRRWVRERHTVTSVERMLDVAHAVDSESGEQAPCAHRHEPGKIKWEVRGYSTETDENGEVEFRNFCYRAPNVVLATGSYDLPNQLHLPGEHQPYVLHSMAQLEQAIKRGDLRKGDGAMNSVSSILGTSPPPASALTASEEPVLIVGAGLSAADAVLLCSALGIPVLHVFRRDGDDPNIVLKKLPPKLYPEYHQVYKMMKDGGDGRNGEDGSGGNYQAYPQYSVKEFKEDGKVLLSHTKGKRGDIIVQVARAVILVGSRPDLSFLPDEGMNLGVVPGMHIDSKHNPIDVDPFTYQCVRAPGLFAMGPPAGDTFVRFLRGGALAITAHLWNKREGKL